MEAEDGAKQASKLHAAVADNNLPLVQQLLSDDASHVDTRNTWEQTPLCVAALNDNADIVCVLLTHGASVRKGEGDWASVYVRRWETPLHVTNSRVVVDMLLAAGADMADSDLRGDTVLHKAVRNGELDIVEYLLSRKELCVDVVNMEGETPLHVVCIASGTETSIRILRLLLANGADINARTVFGCTPLYEAAETGNADIVGELLKHGAHVRKYKWQNLLAVTKSRAIFDMLLAAGADMTDTEWRGDTVLHSAVKDGKLDVVEDLLSRNELCVDVVNGEGETPLHVVCGGSGTETSLRILQLLLANGADINFQTHIGRTPLHYACHNITSEQHVTKVRELLSNGAKLDIADCNGDCPVHTCDELGLSKLFANSVDISSLKDAKGRTILHIAAGRRGKDVVETIVTKFSCVNEPDNIGKTPLHYAALNNNHSGVISCLIEHGAIINAVDTWGQTALHEATRAGNVDALKQLLAVACDVNVTDVTGVTALHVACLNNSIISVEQLLSHCADINLCDNNKSSSLHFAAWNSIRNGNTDIELIDLLVKQCVDIFQKDVLGHTCLDIAILRQNSKIYSALTEQTQIPQKSELVNELSSVANRQMTCADILELMNKEDGVRRCIADAEQYVSHVLTLPGIGRGTDEDEAKEIQAALEDMIQTLADRIGHVDSRFKCVVLHAGSMAEGTKTRLPDEFDFMFCLEEFSKHCESDYHTLNDIYPGCVLAVEIKTKAESDAFMKCSGSDAFLKCSGSNLMRQYEMNSAFSKLLRKTIFDNTFPKHPQLMPTDIYPNPSLTVRWRGPMFKHVDISIDIVPAILLPHWHEKTRKDSVLMTPDILRIPCVAVPKPVSTSRRGTDLWRSSMALVETCIFRKLRPEIRNSYIACKALVTYHILPVINQIVQKFWFMSIFPSYSIKMSFLLAVEKRANRDGLDSVYSKPITATPLNVDEGALNQSNEQKDEIVRSDKDRVKETQETMHSIYYGPASEMNVAVQCADFDMELVREVFQRLEEGIANKFLPSVFNVKVNVLTNEMFSIETNVFIKLIRKLIE